MDSDHAALSSLVSQLEEVTRRVTAMAERYQAGPREDVAADLFEAERGLRTAHRRLSGLLRDLDPPGR